MTPDIIVYCKTRYLYIEHSSTAEKIIDSFRYQLPHFVSEYGYPPKVLVIKDMGIFAVAESYASAECTLDVYEDLIRISFYALQCGGIKFLSPEQVAFIDQWEVENYRRKVSQSASAKNKLNNKTAIVTGGAQGFGAGIAEAFTSLNVNVVVADMNEEAGISFVSGLNSIKADIQGPVCQNRCF